MTLKGRKFQVIHGKELGVPGGYTVSYIWAEVTSIPGNAATHNLDEKMAKEYGTTKDSISYSTPGIMAGGFNQYIYHIKKDGVKIAEYYYMPVDEDNKYVYTF